jgi:hypothetical protein
MDARCVADESAYLADGKIVWSWRPDAGVKSAEATSQATGARKPGPRGERDISRKTIAQGMPGVSGEPVVTTLVCFIYFAREAAGAAGTRLSLRPLFSEAIRIVHRSGALRRENAEACANCDVITCDKHEALAQGSDSDETIQTVLVAPAMDCFAGARNDEKEE